MKHTERGEKHICISISALGLPLYGLIFF